MTPGQISKNWHASARAWFRYKEGAVVKADIRKADTMMWHHLLRAVSGL
jgi:hypothetical protein